MRFKSFVLTAALLLTVTGNASAEAQNYNLLVADQHLIPAYGALAETTGKLNAAAPGCKQGDAGMQQLRDAYADAFLAWQGIQHLRFGPIQTLSRDFRFQLWPDKRGSVSKHLRRLLAEPDPARLEADTFAGGSAAVQGFSALERLLFDAEQPGNNRAWRCQVIAAITANLQRMSAETLSEWTEGEYAHREMFATAAERNDYYDSDEELSAKLLNNLHTQLERLVDQKLGRPMGSELKRALPKRAEAWRSGLSNEALQTNIQAAFDLYRIGFAPRVDDAALNKRVAELFENALALIKEVRLPIAEAVSDATERDKLKQLKTQLASVNAIVGSELTQALGLPLGFNSLDGD